MRSTNMKRSSTADSSSSEDHRQKTTKKDSSKSLDLGDLSNLCKVACPNGEHSLCQKVPTVYRRFANSRRYRPTRASTLRYKPRPGSMQLHAAICVRNVAAVEILLEAGMSMTTLGYMRETPFTVLTLCREAEDDRAVDITRLLIRYKLKFSERDLFHVTYRKFPRILELVLDNFNGDVNYLDKNECTSLSRLVFQRNKDTYSKDCREKMIFHLLKAGANPGIPAVFNFSGLFNPYLDRYLYQTATLVLPFVSAMCTESRVPFSVSTLKRLFHPSGSCHMSAVADPIFINCILRGFIPQLVLFLQCGVAYMEPHPDLTEDEALLSAFRKPYFPFVKLLVLKTQRRNPADRFGIRLDFETCLDEGMFYDITPSSHPCVFAILPQPLQSSISRLQHLARAAVRKQLLQDNKRSFHDLQTRLLEFLPFRLVRVILGLWYTPPD